MSEKYIKVTADGDMAIRVHGYQHFLGNEEFLKLYHELHAIFGKDWIACSDRMPEEGQEVICGWLEHGKIIAHAEIAIFGDIDEYYNGDCISVSQGWSNRDCDELNQYFDNNPTHWHPIPTL